MQEAAALRKEEESYIYEEEVLPASEPPKELKPKHHLKEKVNWLFIKTKNKYFLL